MEPQKMSELTENQNPDVALNADTQVSEPAQKAEKEETIVVVPETKEAIVEAVEKALEKPIDEVKVEIAQLKAAFYAIKKQEIEEEKVAFLALGNEIAAFAQKPDALEDKLKELLASYKEKRAEHLAAIEAEKNENLQKKQDILAKLGEIVADTDNINKHYSKFQQLQQDFKSVGEVPAPNVTQLWKEYQLVTEQFYDLLKINKDLRDYDFKKNLEAKEALCEQAEALGAENDIIAAFKKLQALHEQWREIGPVAQDLRDQIWQRFKDASTLINKKHQSFFEERKEREKENEEAKTALCEKIEAIDLAVLKSYAAWEKATDEIKDLQEDWKKLGFAAHKVNVALFARFRKTCDEFFAKKAEFFKTLKEESAANLQKKIALCEKAEALKDSTDWKKTANELVAIQKEWKTIGPVAKKYSDNVWKRFITACDYFFEQKEKQTSNIHKEEHANLDAKKEIIAALSKLVETESENNAGAQVKDLMAKWRGIGHVPFKEKDKIYNEYQVLVKKAYDKFDLKEVRARLSNFESSVEEIADDSDKLYREREKLVRKSEQKQNELKTFENNMLFFTAKSKSGNSILKDMERRIASVKEELLMLEKKIDLIDSKLQ